MANVRFHVVNAFGKKLFGGNPAAVYPNATAIDEFSNLQATPEFQQFILTVNDCYRFGIVRNVNFDQN